jgi:hypothetical protein
MNVDTTAPGGDAPPRVGHYEVCVDEVVGHGLLPTPALVWICWHLGGRLPGLRRENSKIIINRDTVKAARKFQEEITQHKEEVMNTTNTVMFISKEKNIHVFCEKNLPRLRARYVEGPCPGIEVETAAFICALTCLEKKLSGDVDIV